MDLLDRLLQHDAWTTRQLLLRCRTLDDAQLDREFDIGHRTVRATFAHLIANMEVWGDLMAGESYDPESDARRGRQSILQLIERLDQAAARLEQVARAIAERSGWDERWIDPLDGRAKSYGGAITHVITHSMHHRAQLLYLLRRLGFADLPEGDVLSWEEQVGSSQEPM